MAATDQEKLNELLDQHETWLKSEGKKGKRLDLRQEDLSGLDFSGRRLSRALLSHSNLTRCEMQGVDLTDAELFHVTFDYANLQKAKMARTMLDEASLRGANLKDADLHESSLDDAVFQYALIERADFSGCSGQGADFRYTDGYEARFDASQLKTTDFTGSRLSRKIIKRMQPDTSHEKTLSAQNIPTVASHDKGSWKKVTKKYLTGYILFFLAFIIINRKIEVFPEYWEAIFLSFLLLSFVAYVLSTAMPASGKGSH